jgi:hypothetical protein
MYALSKEEDVNSNQVSVLEANDGKEAKLNFKSNYIGKYKA